MCGVGKWLKRWKEQLHDKCPRCSATNETVGHALICQHQGAKLCWRTGLDGIHAWMRPNNAAPEVTEAIAIGLEQLENEDRGLDSNNDLVLAQRELGWEALLF